MKNIDYLFITHSNNQSLEKERHYIHYNNLFVIIDGVGRSYLRTKSTNLAYSAIMETFFRSLEENNSPGDAISLSMKQANRVIFEERLKINEKMAASVCIIYLEGKIMYFSHLGDTRIYSFQDNELNQLTRDHTLREEDPFAEKRYDDPRALQALIKGLGIQDQPDIHIKKYSLEKKGMIILTTERLTERISNRDFLWLSKKINNPKKLLKSIVELYNRKGGEEEFTLGLIKYGVLPKWLRKILSIYLIFFIFIVVIIGGYHLMYSGNDVSEDSIILTESDITHDHTDEMPVPIDKKESASSQPHEKTVVRQPIIDKGESPVEDLISSDIDLDRQAIDDIHTFLSEWKSAWEMSAGNNGDISEYLSFYSNDFRSGRFNKNGWASDKSLKNRRKKWIRVELSNIEVSNPDKNNLIRVSFSQDYKSSNFSVISQKVLQIKKENNKWVIVSEKSS